MNADYTQYPHYEKFVIMVQSSEPVQWDEACTITESLIDQKERITEYINWAKSYLVNPAEVNFSENKLKGIIAALITRSEGTYLNQIDEEDKARLMATLETSDYSNEDVKKRLGELAETVDLTWKNYFLETKTPATKSGNKWEAMLREKAQINSNSRPPKKLEGMDGVNVSSRRGELVKRFADLALNTIKRNDVYQMVKKSIKTETKEKPENVKILEEFSAELERRTKNIGTNVQKHLESVQHLLKKSNERQLSMTTSLVESLKVQNIVISEEFVEKLSKYFCYLECLELNHEKFARICRVELSSFNFNNVDEKWYQEKIWPFYANPFKSWSERESPSEKTTEDVMQCIEKQKDRKLIQILLSVQLVLNYWEDAYQFCLALQKDEKLKEMGLNMEIELFLAEQKSLFIEFQDREKYDDINARRLPQPKEVEKARKEKAF